MHKLLIILVFTIPSLVESPKPLPLKPLSGQVHERLRPALGRLEALAAAGDVAKLSSHCEALARRTSARDRGERDDYYLITGYCFERAQMPERALAAYQKSLELRAGSAVAHYRTARALQQLGRCTEALPRFKEVLWRANENQAFYPHYRAGECHSELGDSAEAARSLKAAIASNPGFVPALRLRNTLRAAALQKLENERTKKQLRELMITDYQTIVATDPNDTQSKKSLVRLLTIDSDPVYDAERLTKAEQYAVELVESDNYSSPETVRVLFDVLVVRKKTNEAKVVLQRALEQNPAHPVLLEASVQLEIEAAANLAAAERAAREAEEKQSALDER